MTDNIFEMETTAFAHDACEASDSGILLNDIACAYPSVNFSWIFDALEKAELLAFFYLSTHCLQRECDQRRV